MEQNFLIKLEKLGEKNKRKKNFNSRYSNHGNKIPLKKLIKNKTLRKMDEDFLEDQLYKNMYELGGELRKFYIKGESKVFEDREEIADMLTNRNFSKAAKNVLLESDAKGSDMLLFAISDVQLNTGALKEDEKILKRYLKIVAKKKSGMINKLTKTLDIPSVDALLIALMTCVFYRAPRKIVRERTYSTLNLLYETMEGKDLGKKDIKKILSTVFKDNEEDILMYILLEKPNRNAKTEGFELVTEYVLDKIENMDSYDRKDLLKQYAKARKNNTHIRRRVSLINIDEDDYKNISKTVDKLIRNGMDEELFK